MNEKELIDKSRVEGMVKVLTYLLVIANQGIGNKTPGSELWRALLAAELRSCEEKVGTIE